MLDLSNHFGINVKERFKAWFSGEFATQFEVRWPDKGITLVILDPDTRVDTLGDWEQPLKYEIFIGYLGNEEDHKRADGTLHDVAGMLRYTLREDCDSFLAETDFACLRVGDYPARGAGEHRGFYGGVAGLEGEDNWWVFEHCINKLYELIEAVGKTATAKAVLQSSMADAPVGRKYLNVLLTEREVWPSTA